MNYRQLSLKYESKHTKTDSEPGTLFARSIVALNLCIDLAVRSFRFIALKTSFNTSDNFGKMTHTLLGRRSFFNVLGNLRRFWCFVCRIIIKSRRSRHNILLAFTFVWSSLYFHPERFFKPLPATAGPKLVVCNNNYAYQVPETHAYVRCEDFDMYYTELLGPHKKRRRDLELKKQTRRVSAQQK